MTINSLDYKRPRLNPLPILSEEIDYPVICLNGDDWKWNPAPGSKFYHTEWEDVSWVETVVPSEKHVNCESEYAFARLLEIPDSWENKKVFLRFDGVNCLGRVFVDGKFAGSHYGGFVSWDCDITGMVQAGKTHMLTIGVADKPREICTFHEGGIIRDVYLYALPEISLSRLHVQTQMINAYQDAELSIETYLDGGDAQIEYFLTSPKGDTCTLGCIDAKADEESVDSFEISTPYKWDSEHPYLYKLTAVVRKDDRVLEKVERKFGFRQIEKKQDQVFINGQILKLRGVNRHDISYDNGRCITHELVEKDVRLFKEANINFIRTSHYPPRPDFLDLCDEYGIYVEDEIAVAFLGYAANLTQDDPAFREQFLGQFADMIERDKSHPSVIIWSLANESRWGENHGLMLQYARCESPDRLTIFSYPVTQTEEDEMVDIWSVHYANWDSKLDDMTECFRRSFYDAPPIPVLHDESTHVPHHDWKGLDHDPSIRDFWGETLKRFWTSIWETKGALGCAVWAGIDDLKLQNGVLVGPEWGIIDVWRRKKPEYWNIRKAYSPIYIDEAPTDCGQGIRLLVKNRFNHTNLREITCRWKVGEESGSMLGTDIGPGESGFLDIPVEFQNGRELNITFTDPFGFQVEERMWILGGEIHTAPKLCGTAPEQEERDTHYIIYGKSFQMALSKETGLITQGCYQGRLVLKNGPMLHLSGLDLELWELKDMQVEKLSDKVIVHLKGAYGKVAVQFLLSIDAEGVMEVDYTVTDMPYPSPRKVANTSSIVSHQGGYAEVGVAFVVPGDLEKLSWEKRGLWDVYPDWHIGRLTGETDKRNPRGLNIPTQIPEWEWKQDEMDWSVWGKNEYGHHGTRDFSSMKSYIYNASLKTKDNLAGFTALSTGVDSVRMELRFDDAHIISDRSPEVHYSGNWFEKSNRYHSFDGTETWSREAGDWCEYTFEGNGIVWYSSLDRICGSANIYVDGKFMEEVDLGCKRLGKDPRGYKKCYRYPAFAEQNLPFGKHTIKIEVTGKPGADCYNSYVNIDAFLILDGREAGDTRFIIDNEFNYPEISWADYCKPAIRVETGYSGTVYVKLG